MAVPTRSQITGALAEIISTTLRRGEEVHVPGLGTFKMHHQVSQIERSMEGEVVMKPPRDVIAFASEE